MMLRPDFAIVILKAMLVGMQIEVASTTEATSDGYQHTDIIALRFLFSFMSIAGAEHTWPQHICFLSLQTPLFHYAAFYTSN